ncbi:MAG: hypothetical protein V2A64_04905 [Candidatus Omnitrophota bacterium]
MRSLRNSSVVDMESGILLRGDIQPDHQACFLFVEQRKPKLVKFLFGPVYDFLSIL